MGKLLKACIANNYKAVKIHIDTKCNDIDECFKVAYKNKHMQILKLLLNKRQINKDTLSDILFDTCLNKKLAIIKLLLIYGAVDLQSRCLTYACSNNCLDIVNILIKYSKYGINHNQGFEASITAGNFQLTQLMLSQKNINIRYYHFENAIKSGNLSLVKLLNEHFPWYDNKAGQAIYAYLYNQRKILQYLLTELNEADINRFVEYICSKAIKNKDLIDWDVAVCILNNNINYEECLRYFNRKYPPSYMKNIIGAVIFSHERHKNDIHLILNNFNIHNYDTNISKLITEYLPYEY